MGAMLASAASAWETLRSYLPSDHDLFKVAVAILILVAFYLLARIVRMLASKELKRVNADPQVALLVNRMVFLAALILGGAGGYVLKSATTATMTTTTVRSIPVTVSAPSPNQVTTDTSGEARRHFRLAN